MTFKYEHPHTLDPESGTVGCPALSPKPDTAHHQKALYQGV